jgi:hypothetical protein
LDDLRKQLQVMLQEELWKSEMFVWVTVLDMWFHNGKKRHWICPGLLHLSDKVSGPYTNGSYNTKHSYFKIHVKSTALTKNKGMELHLSISPYFYWLPNKFL